MTAYFDVFFHQQAIPCQKAKVIYQKDSIDEIVETCSLLYKHKAGNMLSTLEINDIHKKIQYSVSKKYVEIQFFRTELYWDALLEELVELFPQFLWTKMVEEMDSNFVTYFCEFIPITFGPTEKIYFSLKDSLSQMGYKKNDSVSYIVTQKIHEIFQEEMFDTKSNDRVDIPKDEQSELDSSDSSLHSRAKATHFFDEKNLSDIENFTIDKNLETQEEVFSKDVIYLKESLKRERAAKERLKIAKEKLEYELIAIENRLLTSGLTRFKKYQKSTLREDEWYKFIRIDLIEYDDLYKKAKFIEQSWKLNCQLVTVTEKMTFTKDRWVYERARVEKVKNTVAELELKSMMEQCHLINGRIKVKQGFLFIKPSVKLYHIDFEQLQKISAFFDIIQTENRLLESVIEQEEEKQVS